MYEDPSLKQTIQGNTYDNPVGLAPGFDKSCEVPKALEYLGFGALELVASHRNLKMVTRNHECIVYSKMMP